MSSDCPHEATAIYILHHCRDCDSKLVNGKWEPPSDLDEMTAARDRLCAEVTELSIQNMEDEGRFHGRAMAEKERNLLVDVAAGAVMLLRKVEEDGTHPTEAAMVREALSVHQKFVFEGIDVE